MLVGEVMIVLIVVVVLVQQLMIVVKIDEVGDFISLCSFGVSGGFGDW